MTSSYILTGLSALVRLAIAIVLFQVGTKKKMPNLQWLAWGFLTTVISIPFINFYYLPFLDKALAYIRYLCYAIFIHQTFYRERRSPFVPFWAVFSALFLILLWTTGSVIYQQSGIGFPQNVFLPRPYSAYGSSGAQVSTAALVNSFVDGLLQLGIWLWHAIASYQSYRLIARDRYVDDWIKSRYKLMVSYSILQSLVGPIMMVAPLLSGTAVAITGALAGALTIVTTVMQYMVWAMPGWYSKWLNRNFRIPAEA